MSICKRQYANIISFSYSMYLYLYISNNIFFIISNTFMCSISLFIKLHCCYNQIVTTPTQILVREGGVSVDKLLTIFLVPITVNVISYFIYKLLDWLFTWWWASTYRRKKVNKKPPRYLVVPRWSFYVYTVVYLQSLATYIIAWFTIK